MRFERLGAESHLFVEVAASACTGLLLDEHLQIDTSQPFWLTSRVACVEALGGGPIRGLSGHADMTWSVHGEDTETDWAAAAAANEIEQKSQNDKLYAKYKDSKWKLLVAAITNRRDVLAKMTPEARKNTKRNARRRYLVENGYLVRLTTTDGHTTSSDNLRTIVRRAFQKKRLCIPRDEMMQIALNDELALIPI